MARSAEGRIDAPIDRFEIVVLSDSTNADSWIRETAARSISCAGAAPIMPVWYRRRWRNIRPQVGQSGGLRHCAGAVATTI
jgi:membrane glycosyltransferase